MRTSPATFSSRVVFSHEVIGGPREERGRFYIARLVCRIGMVEFTHDIARNIRREEAVQATRRALMAMRRRSR